MVAPEDDDFVVVLFLNEPVVGSKAEQRGVKNSLDDSLQRYGEQSIPSHLTRTFTAVFPLSNSLATVVRTCRL